MFNVYNWCVARRRTHGPIKCIYSIGGGQIPRGVNITLHVDDRLAPDRLQGRSLRIEMSPERADKLADSLRFFAARARGEDV